LVASAVWLPAPEIAPSDLPVIGLTPLARACVLRAGRAPPVTFPG